MNRIILIGNGFDLAHGLPTRYEDFINWYWEKRIKAFNGNLTPISEDSLCSIKMTQANKFRCWNVFAFNLPHFMNRPTGKEVIQEIANAPKLYELTFSPFFKNICESIETKGWVDIENEYYSLLCNSLFKPNEYDYSISKLNSQLRYVQELLVQYLSLIKIEEINCDNRIVKQIYSPINKQDISISELSLYYDYVDYLIHNADDEYQRLLCSYGIDGPNRHYSTVDIKRLQQYTKLSELEDIRLKDLILPMNILLLNFNYTGVADKYGTLKVTSMNHIHGNLGNPDNIIFGYGDELDEDYNKILKLNDNEYLKYIKSVKYLETSNYRQVLDFIESAPYQIYIMGHSCGNSDRTLLNTLFEHKNCVTIKPFYHKLENGSDNYMEIIQNISRNFTDMKLMRDRVVNKTFCEPLPQNK